MAENGLKVSPDRMRDHGIAAGKMSEEFKTQIENLKTQKNGLMQIWRGQSAKTFEEAVDTQTRELDNFESVLYAMAESIKKGAELFAAAEEENTLEGKKLKDTNYNYR
jgi:WXG100 family type VII secretion target